MKSSDITPGVEYATSSSNDWQNYPAGGGGYRATTRVRVLATGYEQETTTGWGYGRHDRDEKRRVETIGGVEVSVYARPRTKAYQNPAGVLVIALDATTGEPTTLTGGKPRAYVVRPQEVRTEWTEAVRVIEQRAAARDEALRKRREMATDRFRRHETLVHHLTDLLGSDQAARVRYITDSDSVRVPYEVMDALLARTTVAQGS
jgi:hypothetical protein